MIEIKKSPIVIFSTMRSGSTAFLHHLANTLNLKIWNEPETLEIEKEYFQKFLEYSSCNENYILKIITQKNRLSQYPKCFIDYFQSDQIFKIKLIRKNLVNQIASFYLATINQRWQLMTDDFNFYKMPFIQDETIIFQSINQILEQRKLNKQINADVEIFYEDIKDWDADPIKITPKPLNYEDIKSIIKEKLEVDYNIKLS
jgi:hypothetical protein